MSVVHDLILLTNFVCFEDIPDYEELPEAMGELLDGHSISVQEDFSDAPSRAALRKKLTASFAAATKFTEIFKDDKFRNVLKGFRRLARTLNYISGGIGVIVDLFMVFWPSEPEPMLLEMRESFKEVNAKLNQIETQISSLSEAIDWKFKKDDFDDYTRKITTLSEKLGLLMEYEPNSPAFDSKRQDIIDYYDDFDSHEFVNFLTDVSFFQTYITNTGNDRKKVLNLAKVVTYYIMRANNIDMAYLRLKNVTRERIDEETQFWNNTFVEIQDQITTIDDQVKNARYEQGKIDVYQLISSYQDQTNEALSKLVVNHLSEKYFWRDWFVAVADAGGEQKVTGEDYRLENHGKICLVASVPEDDYFDSEEAESALNRNVIECKCDWRCKARHFFGAKGEECCLHGAGYILYKTDSRGGINMKLVHQSEHNLYTISSVN